MKPTTESVCGSGSGVLQDSRNVSLLLKGRRSRSSLRFSLTTVPAAVVYRYSADSLPKLTRAKLVCRGGRRSDSSAAAGGSSPLSITHRLSAVLQGEPGEAVHPALDARQVPVEDHLHEGNPLFDLQGGALGVGRGHQEAVVGASGAVEPSEAHHEALRGEVHL